MAVVQALVGLGRALSLDIVAEGVETTSQADRLREVGCGFGQGYLWGRPTTAHRFLERLAGQNATNRREQSHSLVIDTTS